ncbi:MAG: hypothetical protein EOO07_36425 [Chitinophagaceae bacterium]|nr:MAG: hypothetical protein EOO07_36425 [Chitinophagaceae bacterium]
MTFCCGLTVPFLKVEKRSAIAMENWDGTTQHNRRYVTFTVIDLTEDGFTQKLYISRYNTVTVSVNETYPQPLAASFS